MNAEREYSVVAGILLLGFSGIGIQMSIRPA